MVDTINTLYEPSEQAHRTLTIGLVVLTDEERDVFRAQSTGTSAAYVEIVGDRGQELLDALQSELSGN